MTENPESGDFALSQGIVLLHTTSLVGATSPPFASDENDCVFVTGELEVEDEGAALHVRRSEGQPAEHSRASGETRRL